MRKIKFITGPAGTGKSHRLRELLSQESRPYLICAPTGIAAVNVGGSTIHRTFGINVESGFIAKRWNEVEAVYIDEASMMGSRLFELAAVAAPNAEFIFVGDMAQLAPIKDKFWFQANCIKDFDIEIERLTTQWRQKDDPEFSRMLNLIRLGKIGIEDLRYMYSHSTLIEENHNAVTLAFRNDTVRAINYEKLCSLDTKLFSTEAIYSGIMKPTDCNAENVLDLKEGCDVLFLNNDVDKRWMNGTRGTVLSILETRVDVVLNDGKTVYVEKHTWKMKVPQKITPQRIVEIYDEIFMCFDKARVAELRHTLDIGIEYVVAGTCIQFPLKLAYALTVHKSQGMTINNVSVISSGFAGCHGIGYVALSRTRSLDTLTLDRRLSKSDFKFNTILTDFV